MPFVKPAKPGLIVRDPLTKQPIPDNGCNVPDDSFWRRRMKDNDVVVVKSPAPVKKTEAVEKEAVPETAAKGDSKK